jgi:hypothetical protein
VRRVVFLDEERMMGLRAEYALHHSGLEAFLFAPLWQEENGSTLSVLSALARLGIDPWKEAAVLANKSKKDAADCLAAVLARLPRAGIENPSRSNLAERAVKLLPNGAADASAKARDEAPGNRLSGPTMLILAVAAMLAFLLTLEWPI